MTLTFKKGHLRRNINTFPSICFVRDWIFPTSRLKMDGTNQSEIDIIVLIHTPTYCLLKKQLNQSFSFFLKKNTLQLNKQIKRKTNTDISCKRKICRLTWKKSQKFGCHWECSSSVSRLNEFLLISCGIFLYSLAAANRALGLTSGFISYSNFLAQHITTFFSKKMALTSLE